MSVATPWLRLALAFVCLTVAGGWLYVWCAVRPRACVTSRFGRAVGLAAPVAAVVVTLGWASAAAWGLVQAEADGAVQWKEVLTAGAATVSAVLGLLAVLTGYGFYRINRQPCGGIPFGPGGVLVVSGAISLTGVLGVVAAALMVVPVVA